jgi:hypothetical protein
MAQSTSTTLLDDLNKEVKAATSMFELSSTTAQVLIDLAARAGEIATNTGISANQLKTIATSIDGLKTSVEDLKHSVNSDLSTISVAMRILFQNARVVITKSEHIQILAVDSANETMQAHLKRLEKKVGDAITQRKLDEFIEHLERWPESARSPTEQTATHKKSK